MSTNNKKLTKDLSIIAAMASEMEAYLDSDVLFWSMRTSAMPKLTLGGYMMRQHRLLILQDLLTTGESSRLDAAVIEFNSAVSERIVRFEQKAHRELNARLRQWSENLKDIDRGLATLKMNYATAVEVRAMITALVDRLELAPFSLEKRIPQQVAFLDTQLRGHWEPGDFVWPSEWQPAYPEGEYWWLYGQLKEK